MPTRLHRWIPLAVALLAMRAANALAQGCAMCASSFEPNARVNVWRPGSTARAHTSS